MNGFELLLRMILKLAGVMLLIALAFILVLHRLTLLKSSALPTWD